MASTQHPFRPSGFFDRLSAFSRQQATLRTQRGPAPPFAAKPSDSPMCFRERMNPKRFFRGERAVAGPLTLTHRRIYIVPNRAGLGLGLLLLIQWLAAINYSNNLGFILTFLLSALAVIGMLHCFRNLSGLVVAPEAGEAVFAGERARFRLCVRNPASLQRPQISVRLHGLTPMHIDVEGDETATAELLVTAPRRGWLDVGTVTVSTVYPLGIFYAWSPLNFTPRILVYPAPAPDVLPLPFAGEEGKASQFPQPSAEEFQGFQPYQRGDPIRHLYWKGLAKGQAPQLKRFGGEESVTLHLDWARTPGGNLEARISRLCRWVLDAERDGLSYSLTLPGRRIALGSGTTHCRACLEALALFDL